VARAGGRSRFSEASMRSVCPPLQWGAPDRTKATQKAARVQSCFALIASLEGTPTNLLHRGRPCPALRYAQCAARVFLDDGRRGYTQLAASRANVVHQSFVTRPAQFRAGRQTFSR